MQLFLDLIFCFFLRLRGSPRHCCPPLFLDLHVVLLCILPFLLLCILLCLLRLLLRILLQLLFCILFCLLQCFFFGLLHCIILCLFFGLLHCIILCLLIFFVSSTVSSFSILDFSFFPSLPSAFSSCFFLVFLGGSFWPSAFSSAFSFSWQRPFSAFSFSSTCGTSPSLPSIFAVSCSSMSMTSTCVAISAISFCCLLPFLSISAALVPSISSCCTWSSLLSMSVFPCCSPSFCKGWSCSWSFVWESGGVIIPSTKPQEPWALLCLLSIFAVFSACVLSSTAMGTSNPGRIFRSFVSSM